LVKTVSASLLHSKATVLFFGTQLSLLPKDDFSAFIIPSVCIFKKLIYIGISGTK
jgi:hypothetical protein